MAKADVRAARYSARTSAKASGAGPRQVQQAGRQAARATRQAPPPPPQPPPQADPGTPGGFQYSPTLESQLNQPYQDVMSAGNLGQLPAQYGRMDAQGQLGDIYGNTAAGSLGQYGQLMQPNLQIQQGLGNEIQQIQSGKTDVDPAMLQQFDQQQRDLQAQLQRQLGPDWATSSAGIEAMGRFQQGKHTALASANFNRLQGLVNMQQGGMQNIGNMGGAMGSQYSANNMDLYNQQQGLRQGQLTGAGQMLANTGTTQQLYANIPQTMGQFGQAMSGQSNASVNAQQPFAQDRYGQFIAAQQPTSGQAWGQGLQNSGNRWIAASSSGAGSPGNTQTGQGSMNMLG